MYRVHEIGWIVQNLSEQFFIVLAVMVGIAAIVFPAYITIRFLFRLVVAKADPNESTGDTELRRSTSFVGILTVICSSFMLWFLYKASSLPVIHIGTSSKTYYFYAFLAGDATLGALGEYINLQNSKQCRLCKQNIRKNAVRCSHCGGTL